MLTPRELSPPSERAYHSKRPHKKSRSGCKNCKTRKVKCDEAHPACRNCVLRKADCIYPPPSSAQDQHDQSESSPSQPSHSPVVSRGHSPAFSTDSGDFNVLVTEPLFSPSSDIDSTDLRLLWFYTTTSFTSFATQAGRESRTDDILRVKIPQAAFANPFLMNCLFGLSALHLQSLNQDIDPSRVMRYRAQAFEGYRKAIEEAKPDSYAALIACSLMLTALSAQMFREEDTKELYIVDWMIVWRGIGLIIDLISPQKLWESGMAELFFRPKIDLNRASLHIPNNLLFMVSSISITDPEYADVQTYYDTLKYLGSLYSELMDGFGPIMSLRIITWFTFLPNEFVEFSRQRRPRALIILAHYLMFMKLIEKLWWVRGIGNRQIRGIDNYLGERWRSHLSRPLLALDAPNIVEVARLLLDDPEWTPPDNADPFEGDSRDPRAKSLTWVDNSGKKLNVVNLLAPGKKGGNTNPASGLTEFSGSNFPPQQDMDPRVGAYNELDLEPIGLGLENVTFE